MKCHKCGFVSFDYLSDCKKCGVNLEGSRSLLGLMDFKPTMPFFLGAMVSAQAKGANGRAADLAAPNGDAVALAEIEFGGDLEFEIEEDVPTAGQYSKAGDLDVLPQIELPEGFSLSLGEEEKADDLELVIGPEFEQALSLELDAKDFDDLAQSASVKEDLAGLELTDPIIDFSASARPAVSEMAEVEPLVPELSLDISLELESTGVTVPGARSQPVFVQEPVEENMVIDFSQSDFENLLVELDDNPMEKKVGQSAIEQLDTHA
jgi:hypothetical protein